MGGRKKHAGIRVLSVLLVVVLVAGFVPAAALAETVGMGEEPIGAMSVGATEDMTDEGNTEQEIPASAPAGQSNQGVVEEVTRDTEGQLAAQAVSVSAPRVRADSSTDSGQVATWDCVWFGSYPQSEVAETDDLKNATWTDGDATVGDVRYRRITRDDAIFSEYWPSDAGKYRYFRYEPIKWRVLEVSDSTALVVADSVLDERRYNENYTWVTWSDSSIRSWLNGYAASCNQPERDYSSGNFFATAFSGLERELVPQIAVVNANSMFNGYGGGPDTDDRVFLLSEAEVYSDTSTTHGFVSDYETRDEARRCKPTDFAHAMGVMTYRGGSRDGCCDWWLRSVGEIGFKACYVGNEGQLFFGGLVNCQYIGVRPAMKLKLSSLLVRPAGTVSSNGDVNETNSGNGGVHLMDGYSFKRDAYRFSNASLEMPMSYWLKAFYPARARLLWSINDSGGLTGMCYGMANSTYSLLSGFPSVSDVCRINAENVSSVEKISGINSISNHYVRAKDNAVPLSDYIRFSWMMQFEPHWRSMERSTLWHGPDELFARVKEQVDAGVSKTLIHLRREKFVHTVYAVGYAEFGDEKIIFTDDSMVRSGLCEMRVGSDGIWSYDPKELYPGLIGTESYPNLNNTNTELTWSDASGAPYVALRDSITPDPSWGWKKWPDPSEFATESDEVSDRPVFDDGSQLVGVKGDGYEVDCDGAVSVLPVYEEGDDKENDYEYDDLFWVPETSPILVNNLDGSDGSVTVAEERFIVKASASEKSSVGLEKTDDDVKMTVTSSENANVTIEVQKVADDASVSTLSIAGAVSGGATTLQVLDSGCSLEGLRDATLKFNNENGTDEVSVANQGGGTIGVTVDEQNAQVNVATAPIDIATCNVKLEWDAVVYDGSDHKPAVTVSLGDEVLVKDNDYELGYMATVDAGTATVTVKGKGNFTGTKSATFRIDPAKITDVTVSQASFTYDGTAKTPAVTVKAGSLVVPVTGYTVKYANNVNVGTATVTVTGKRNFAGGKSATFKITSVPIPGQMPAPTQTPTPTPTQTPTPTSTPTKTPTPASTSSPEPTPTPVRRFPDVPADAWYAGVVSRAAELGLIRGYKDGRFGPDDNVTRGQVAVILWNMAGKPAPKGTARSFPDVAAGKYYYDAVAWASSVGVVSGYKTGKFGPEDNVTREQLAAMLANYAGKVSGRDTSGSAADYGSMKDADKVSSWAAKSVGWCFRNKIISGTKDGNVNPQGNATRAETAKMVVFLHDMP